MNIESTPEFVQKVYEKLEATEKNPVCTSDSEYRVIRGGSGDNPAEICRSALRNWSDPGFRDRLLGFRPTASSW